MPGPPGAPGTPKTQVRINTRCPRNLEAECEILDRTGSVVAPAVSDDLFLIRTFPQMNAPSPAPALGPGRSPGPLRPRRPRPRTRSQRPLASVRSATVTNGRRVCSCAALWRTKSSTACKSSTAGKVETTKQMTDFSLCDFAERCETPLAVASASRVKVD